MGWLIVADDLTGAADCAIAFGARGIESVVTWGSAAQRVTAPVLSVDAGSRSLPQAAAVQRQLATQAAHWQPGIHLYKKIDSTLRGQPAAELAAQLAVLAAGGGAPLAVVAPAFPAAGRVTLGGRMLLNGVPLERTSLWRRDHTYANAFIPELLASAGLAAEAIPHDAMRAGAEAVHARMADSWHRGVAAVVCDCVSETDLAVIATASLRLPAAAWVGSAGLARALAALEQPGGTTSPRLGPHRGGVLTVVGSLAERSRMQAHALLESGRVKRVSLDPAALLAGPEVCDWRPAQMMVAEALGAGRDVLLEIAAAPHPDLVRGAEIASRLAALVAPVAAAIGALVVTGGETAYALLSGFGIHGIRLLEEVEPGVPLGVTMGARSFPVVTKAGDFGDADTLCRCLARLGS